MVTTTLDDGGGEIGAGTVYKMIYARSREDLSENKQGENAKKYSIC
jgi:hypothetical protein